MISEDLFFYKYVYFVFLMKITLKQTGGLLLSDTIVLYKGPDPAFAKVITPGAWNTKVYIPISTVHPLHVSEPVRLCPCHCTDNLVTCIWTDATSHIVKTGLITGMEILCRNTATGYAGSTMCSYMPVICSAISS